MINLATEMKILAKLKLPHIVKIRATAEFDPLQLQRGNFIMLDRLHDTLKTRLISWKREKTKLWNKFKSKAQKLFYGRLMIAYDISMALEYLHQHK